MQLIRQDDLALWGDDLPATENPEFLTRQLITYIGNKRTLLGHIATAVESVKRALSKKRLICFDVFSGSGVVSRLLKAHSHNLVTNDLEDYAAVIARCFLANRSEVDLEEISEFVTKLNQQVLEKTYPIGFIEQMYAPADESNITKEDRVFYTRNNARRLDNYRRLIGSLPARTHDFLLGPLLSEASIHANTAGVFKGFYKDRVTQVGKFGGSGSDALLRILGDICLEAPILSNFESEVTVMQCDANEAVRRVSDCDLAYIDPPYNQHPYGSNYFMLNLITHYKKPQEVSKVSGIPTDWKRSGYNVKSESKRLFADLVARINARFILVSFNNEGFITPVDMNDLLKAQGEVTTIETKYNAYRGSRSFANRSIHTTEHMFLLKKK